MITITAPALRADIREKLDAHITREMQGRSYWKGVEFKLVEDPATIYASIAGEREIFREGYVVCDLLDQIQRIIFEKG